AFNPKHSLPGPACCEDNIKEPAGNTTQPHPFSTRTTFLPKAPQQNRITTHKTNHAMSSTSPLTLLVVVVALLATTITAIPFSYPYSSPYSCGSYASRLYNYYSGMCPTFYPTPYTGGCHTGRCAPYVGSGTGAGPINLNNMNKVNIGPAPAPASQATPIAEDTTTGAAPATTDEASMAAQSEEESTGLGKLQKRCYKCIAYKMRKVVYALPSCMGFRSGACPYSRKTIAPVAVPYAVPASNNIMINDRNKGV
ncbi:hypothetical protein BC936DRAFT_148470, partial [Jimgerdemannia flammicorona]